MKTLHWIDDIHDQNSPPKGPAKRRLEKGLNVELNVVTVSARLEFGKFLSEIDPTTSCGVVMDYQLTKVGDNGTTAFGNTWAAEIRAAHPNIPVIGISHERESDIPKLRLEAFLAFFARNDLMGYKPPLENLAALLKGYADVCDAQAKKPIRSGVELLIEVTRPSEATAELLRSAIPSSLRGNWDVESPHTAGRWIWHDLQGLPGFLLDEIGLATELGLNLEGFQRVHNRFKKARYQGAFASDSKPRWWASEIRAALQELIGKDCIGPLSTERDLLLGLVKVKKDQRRRLFSHAHGRKLVEGIPDCVAYIDDLREEPHRVQAFFADTYVDERDANPAFGFTARRVFGTSPVHE